MGNNPEFRVEIHPTTLTTGFGLRFIHPTIAGPIKNEVPPTPTKQPQPPFTRRHVSFVIRSPSPISSALTLPAVGVVMSTGGRADLWRLDGHAQGAA